MLPAAPWTIADLVDFEYLLTQGNTTATCPDDRALFRSEIQPQLDGQRDPDRRTLLHAWLQARRRHTTSPLPGRHFIAGWQMLLTLGAFGGLLLGCSVAFGHLAYRGVEPINLPKLLLWTLGVQWLVLIIALAFVFLRRALPDFRDFYPLQTLLWALDAGLRRLPGAQRDHLRATLGVLRRKREIYGSLAVWPLVVVTQVFAVAFNLGAILSILVLIQVVDVRFGWQTTPDVNEAAAHTRVAAFAFPWSWAPHAYPTQEQIADSRYAPGQPLEKLSATATRAWWPFLVYSLIFYGLLVRAALLVYAAAHVHSALRALRFDHADANALLRRMTGPVLEAVEPEAALVIPPASLPPQLPTQGPAVAILARDSEIDPAPLGAALKARFGWDLAAVQQADIDRPGGNTELLAALPKLTAGCAAVVVIIRAKRPPIRAIALFLQRLAAAVREGGSGPELLLLLHGKVSTEGLLPVEADDLTHWQNFNAIHGLHLGIECWQP